VAAAVGAVIAQEMQPAYRNVIEIDHGDDPVTRDAQLPRFTVHNRDFVKKLLAAPGASGPQLARLEGRQHVLCHGAPRPGTPR